MNAYHAGSGIHELEHYEKYFASHTDYITDLEDIKAHIEKYNMTTNGIPIENSGLYDDKLLKDDPVSWLHNLKLNLNSEAIFMLFTDSENDNSYNYIII